MTSLLIDFYGVLVPGMGSEDRACVEKIAGVSGIHAAHFWQCYHEHRPALLTGEVSEQTWWEHVAQETGLTGVDLARLAAADMAGMLHEPTQRVDALMDLVDSGVTAGVIANVPVSVAHHLRDMHSWLEDLDAVVFSCDIALLASDSRVFSVALDAMGTAQRDTTFVSADPGHVASAEAAGVRAIDISTVHDLEELL